MKYLNVLLVSGTSFYYITKNNTQILVKSGRTNILRSHNQQELMTSYKLLSVRSDHL